MKYNNWTTPTQKPKEALRNLISALDSGLNAWIEIQNNGEQNHPIKIKNPALDNPFNWRSKLQTSTTFYKNRDYFNDTVKDLDENWTSCFGTKEAVEEYQKTGKLSEDLVRGFGKSTPIRKKDFLKLRPDLGENYKLLYNLWSNKDNVPRWIVDESIGKVLVVCYDKTPLEKWKYFDIIKKNLDVLEEFVKKGLDK